MCLPIIYQFFKYLLAGELERTQTVKFVWSFGIICLGLSLSSLSVYAGNTYTGSHAKSSFVSNRMVQGLPPTVSSVSDMNLTREEDGFARNQTWSSLKKIFSTDTFLRYTLSHALCARMRTFGDRAFSANASTLWNSLPLHICSAPSLPMFKKQVLWTLFPKSFYPFPSPLFC